MKVRMDDGTEIEGGPGDTAVISPGHDAWVVGNEPCIGIDLTLLAQKTWPRKHDGRLFTPTIFLL